MSYQGQTWVDEIALPHLKNTGELVIMLRVANHAGNGPRKMSGCFAGSETLAEECLMSPRAAQGHLRELSRRHLLVPGDPRLVEHIRPDRRPPVWDLAGAHEADCPGGHAIDGDCLPADTGSRICHPSDQEKRPRSAGSKNCHPSPGEGATGSKKRQPRVAKSATKSSKELKVLSPSGGSSPSNADTAPSAEAQGEREAAEPNNNPGLPAAFGASDADKVVDAYIGAYMTATGLPPQAGFIQSVRAAAEGLLSVGRSVSHLSGLAAEMGAKGWTDLAKHALHNPEPASGPSGSVKPWCGECNYGREPQTAAQRLVETDAGMTKCSCHPGYVPPQTVRA
ncbi:hypothetical protein AB0F30_33395 [Streptomyces sp. NPDC029006]|uniref:hypothetical protein n=1 Tax=Streptomyces sp. NPDC029006 TaxID=3155467 RepID=UPI0033FE7297